MTYRKTNEQQRKEREQKIISMHNRGMPHREISKQFGMNVSRVKDIIIINTPEKQLEEVRVFVPPKVCVGERIEFTYPDSQGGSHKKRDINGIVEGIYKHHALLRVGMHLESFQYWDIWKYGEVRRY